MTDSRRTISRKNAARDHARVGGQPSLHIIVRHEAVTADRAQMPSPGPVLPPPDQNFLPLACETPSDEIVP